MPENARKTIKEPTGLCDLCDARPLELEVTVHVSSAVQEWCPTFEGIVHTLHICRECAVLPDAASRCLQDSVRLDVEIDEADSGAAIRKAYRRLEQGLETALFDLRQARRFGDDGQHGGFDACSRPGCPRSVGEPGHRGIGGERICSLCALREGDGHCGLCCEPITSPYSCYPARDGTAHGIRCVACWAEEGYAMRDAGQHPNEA